MQDGSNYQSELNLRFEQKVPYVMALWDELLEAQRQELLSLDLSELQQTAIEWAKAYSNQPG